jgi:hypothetical protein
MRAVSIVVDPPALDDCADFVETQKPVLVEAAFIISRRFSDEFVAKTRVKELEAEVLQLMQRVEEYRQRVAELMARQQQMVQ